ncbi:universal stress protein [Actinomycetospora soli]|uniref:universal stress protein n=1 Tax=Actinomycetospora soli TaxID=2893887 RepID=UPI001E5853EB|nr:universal stress protein [Actinomycetospora soli]MCD2191077.1 universal stress protein [Actinomycetospora soli]
MTGPLDESSADVHSGALAADDLVVGFDGSPTSVDALALATPLARLWKVGLRVVTVHQPVVLGGRRSEEDRELAAARCARDGASRLGAGVRLSWGERRAADVVAGLHAAAVTSAGLVVGRPRHRVSDRGFHRTVLEDAPVPVALARRHLLPHPALRHVVLGLTGEGSDTIDVLLAFAGRLRHLQDVLVTVAGLDAGVGSGFLADAVFQVGGALGRRARGAVLPARDAARRWDGDELVVCVGRPRGAHGHQGADAVERILLAEDGPSLLVLPPTAVS